AEQLDLILAHVCFDRQRGGLADTRQFLQRARGALHEVADTVDVEDDEILAVTVDDALELADHARVYLADATAASKAPAKRIAARSMATFPNKQDRNLVDRPAATTTSGSVTPPPPSARRCGDDARGTPRSRARRPHPPTADRPSAAARRSSCESAPSRCGRRQRWSFSRDSGRIRRPAGPRSPAPAWRCRAPGRA